MDTFRQCLLTAVPCLAHGTDPFPTFRFCAAVSRWVACGFSILYRGPRRRGDWDEVKSIHSHANGIDSLSIFVAGFVDLPSCLVLLHAITLSHVRYCACTRPYVSNVVGSRMDPTCIDKFVASNPFPTKRTDGKTNIHRIEPFV